MNKNIQTNYSLSGGADKAYTGTVAGAVAAISPALATEKKGIAIALLATITTSVLSLVSPLLVGHAIDTYIVRMQYDGVVRMGILFAAVSVTSFAANYVQMRVMGGVAQRVLWRLRRDLFSKLQELPLAFFNQNKSGDLISRINNDTEKVNEFFSQSLIFFASNIFMMIGTGIFLFSIEWRLAIAVLAPAILIVIFSKLAGGWVTRKNRGALESRGLLSAEIEESISNFKVILAFDRRDYFRSKFGKANRSNYKAAFQADAANELYTPVFELVGNIALILLIGYGLYLVSTGQFAVGLLVSFVLYVTRFYDPLRTIARQWSALQTALAAWDRIGVILNFTSDLKTVEAGEGGGRGLLEFRNVSFSYAGGKDVLQDVSFVLEKGKTYALVGPTGGGKTTTASLAARLFDPTQGEIYLEGRDIRSYLAKERTRRIGFILQEPYLFSGTVRENLQYGFDEEGEASGEQFEKALAEAGFDRLLERFEKGLDTRIESLASLSLGERQIIAFMRAVLRKPDILILDEATANIDTVTENVLEEIIGQLPADTVRIIIAHRLNTIENADSIFFVNGGRVEEAGSMEHAVDLLLHGKRES